MDCGAGQALGLMRLVFIVSDEQKAALLQKFPATLRPAEFLGGVEAKEE